MTLPRNEKEMAAFVRKIQKAARKMRPHAAHADDMDEDVNTSRRAPRYVDRAGERDTYVEDASADEIFREMKRRDF